MGLLDYLSKRGEKVDRKTCLLGGPCIESPGVGSKLETAQVGGGRVEVLPDTNGTIDVDLKPHRDYEHGSFGGDSLKK